MKNCKKISTKIIFIVILIINLILFIKNSFTYVGIIDIITSKNKTSFYTFGFFGFNMQVIKQSQKFGGLKIVELSTKDLEHPKVLKNKDKKYIGFITEDAVRIYSLRGDILWEYKLTNQDNYIFSNCIIDFNKDSFDEIFLITGKKNTKYGENLVILTLDDGIRVRMIQDMKGFNPWKVQTADVDGDKELEVSIGVYKKAEFHPVMAKRPFIYGLDEKGLFPKWRGSRLSRPFDDYIFSDVDGDGTDELLSIETLQDGKKIISAYKWKGFGFELFSESKSFDNIFSIIKEKENVHVRVKDNKYLYWGTLKYEGEKLLLEDKAKEYFYRITLEGD